MADKENGIFNFCFFFVDNHQTLLVMIKAADEANKKRFNNNNRITLSFIQNRRELGMIKTSLSNLQCRRSGGGRGIFHHEEVQSRVRELLGFFGYSRGLKKKKERDRDEENKNKIKR